MKMLIPFTILALVVFTSCTSALYQEARQESDGAIEEYEDARMKFDPEEMKSELKTQLAGKWQFIGIEIPNETVNAQTANPTSGNNETALPSDTNVQTPTAHESPQTDTDERITEGDQVRLSPITVEEREDNQKIAAAKMALAAANRKNLTLEFYEE